VHVAKSLAVIIEKPGEVVIPGFMMSWYSVRKSTKRQRAFLEHQTGCYSAPIFPLKLTVSIMQNLTIAMTISVALTVSFPLTQAVRAADGGTDAVFVSKVSQGGMYEVKASQLAKQRAIAQDVKDLATSEIHDHELVNTGLKKLADAAGIAVLSELNPEFQKRLAALTS